MLTQANRNVKTKIDSVAEVGKNTYCLPGSRKEQRFQSKKKIAAVSGIVVNRSREEPRWRKHFTGIVVNMKESSVQQEYKILLLACLCACHETELDEVLA